MITVQGLSKSYPGGPGRVLSNVDLTVAPGDVLWVSGPSGSGKTTLLNVLGLLSRADTGRYLLDGNDMMDADHATRTRARRHLISTVFQRGNLFAHLSAVENVVLGLPGRKGDRATAREHLAAVGMVDRADRLAGLLSGGEQGRVAIARAAARETPILLADEPVAGLDDDNAEAVLTLLADAAGRGVALVVVSHDARTARIATDRLPLGSGQTC